MPGGKGLGAGLEHCPEFKSQTPKQLSICRLLICPNPFVCDPPIAFHLSPIICVQSPPSSIIDRHHQLTDRPTLDLSPVNLCARHSSVDLSPWQICLSSLCHRSVGHLRHRSPIPAYCLSPLSVYPGHPSTVTAALRLSSLSVPAVSAICHPPPPIRIKQPLLLRCHPAFVKACVTSVHPLPCPSPARP
jgi:hypothetical protein